MSGPISWKSDSSRFTSTTWPTPECTPTSVANAATRPVTSSVRAIGGSSGPPSGSPLIAANPLIASAIVANPGRVAYGPSWPKPVIRVITSLRVARQQHVGPEAEALERARSEVLDEHVGLVAEPVHHLEVAR